MQKKIKFTLKILFSILVTSSTNYYSKEGVKKKKMINRSSHRAIILRPYKMPNV